MDRNCWSITPVDEFPVRPPPIASLLVCARSRSRQEIEESAGPQRNVNSTLFPMLYSSLGFSNIADPGAIRILTANHDRFEPQLQGVASFAPAARNPYLHLVE